MERDIGYRLGAGDIGANVHFVLRDDSWPVPKGAQRVALRARLTSGGAFSASAKNLSLLISRSGIIRR
jgi:hypothetical protein